MKQVSMVKAWSWVRRQPGDFRVMDLRRILRSSTESCAQILQRLRTKGAVDHNGRTGHASRWHATNRQAIVEDMRGMAPGSLACLYRHPKTTGNAHRKDKQRTDWCPAPTLENNWHLVMLSIDNTPAMGIVDTQTGEASPKKDAA